MNLALLNCLFPLVNFRLFKLKVPTREFWAAARVWVWGLARFPYKNKRKRTDEEGKIGFDQKQQKSFMNSFNLALCLTPRLVAGDGGPSLVRLCVVARPFTKTKGNGQAKRERQDLIRI